MNGSNSERGAHRNPFETALGSRSGFLLRAIQQAYPEGILVVNSQNVVLTCNQRFAEVWRLPEALAWQDASASSPVTEKWVMDTISRLSKDSDAFLRGINHIRENPHIRDHCHLELNDGRTIERISTGLYGNDNDYLGRVWFFRDITESKQTEADLRDLIRHDPLTGVMNRSHFFDRADEELMRAARYQRPLGILMLDLDHFRKINDSHGHAAGDQVLLAVCERWRNSLRSMDLLARLGGEEFAVLLPETGLEGATVAAERLRILIVERAVPLDEGEIRCTVSIGVSVMHEADRSIDDALHRADNALYRAKDDGRNRVNSTP